MSPELQRVPPAGTATERVRANRRTIMYLVADASAWVGGFIVASWARYELGVTVEQAFNAAVLGGAAAVLHVGVSAVRRIRSGRPPLGSIEEVRGLAGTTVVTAAAVLLTILALDERPLPASAPVIGGALALLLMLSLRLLHRHRRDRALRPDARSAAPVLLFGLGEAGQGLVRAMLSDPKGRYLPVGALDDDPGKRDLRIAGVPVLGSREELGNAVRRTGATTVILSVANANATLIREIREATLRASAAFKILPPVRELVDHRITVNDVRDVQIGDLLGRRQVVGDLTLDDNGLTGRRILVTGAGGSIGSELCRQIMRANPAELMMLDRDESALHGLQMSLTGRALLDGPELILADLRDDEGIRRIMQERQPEIVFHAAALKHLTLLQRHPGEAIKTNVWGTLTVLDACRDVARFVNISTDKAANPISVLGYSKRITEMLTAHAAANYPGTFLSVRFGNVLSSRGSVVTAFQRQIESGQPLTVTHPDVTRYLMTVQEAVHLVLQAAQIGRDGEALVLDMGEPVRIDDLARRLVAQASSPVQILYTGLRPGEKLHEDLLGQGESDHRPLHPLISHVTVPVLDPPELGELDPFDEPERVIDQLARLCGALPATAAGEHQAGIPLPADRSVVPAVSPRNPLF
ncbi:NDP-sugar epimerase, includes UDP-GlcNAc-inverting 4,6-dehydratase FlaA1 and capsular polysaccharide biosynthesis protein EpsC [Micromonospora phaseoli]|uniref:NDP-sugar epimerase, includes UDP-GlcNAc-inverting 4,6-dehydratase FlaA1 and capsular polysaccharide biosynthesis protein EpsC n=1 Tax=Micromonospora phaseoli TaxID=1144548 RepID=A0A1H6SGG1_9ACTN|nr:FlaA1/EpsC-like NDP-sugar epimerase [Micromonospora phaseoli]GIJ77672.1 dTDP-glucose 4,6-dehydratase [Micromonospora phaseoli]SEI65966.1 NDP-sugar epimerase, includes UDP-GlcNAc-inverting 4,6-dehydratase FlaA1 and capsular polysaccharide biosynthesis protein EpsC [Micromonospora phaseoli]